MAEYIDRDAVIQAARPPMDWTPLEITIPADREAVALALYRAGYTVRQRRRKDGSKTVIYIEYRRET